MSTKSFSQSFIASTDPSSSLPSPSAPPLNLSTKKEKKLQGWQHSAAGSMGGMTGAIVTSPFDVVKTRLQSDMFRHSSDEGVRHAAEVAKKGGGGGIRGVMWQFVDTVYLIKRIGVEEGWRALYKGLGPSLVGIIPARAINFYFYPTSKVYLAKQFPNAPTEKPGQTAEDSPVIHLGAAIVAGIMTSTGTNPIWVVKTRLQLSARKKETGAISTKSGSFLPKPIAASAASLASQTSTPVSTAAISAAASAAATRTLPRSNLTPAFSMTMDIIKKEGIRGLYRGLSASYLGVSEGVIQWVLYERFKRLNAATTTHLESQPLLSYIPHIVGASGGAKAVASLITYPHEVIRTRLRQPALPDGTIKYKGLLQTLKLVWVEEGVGALYGGLTAHLFRVVPNAACMFLIYELVAAKLGA
ncbi:solute carrier family 25, member 33/36 [Cryptococcus deuterogattii 2001/935-1]|nr:solute carrier family 25, member 33/36 [Cryptococcus deuterogattii 2001/935-1]